MTDALGTDARMTVDPPGSLVARDARLRIEGATRTGGHALTRRSGRYGRYGSTCPSETARPMIARIRALREQCASWAICPSASTSFGVRHTGMGLASLVSFLFTLIGAYKVDIERSRSISSWSVELSAQGDYFAARLGSDSRNLSYAEYPCPFRDLFSSKIFSSLKE